MTRTFRPVTEWQRAWMRKCFAIIARMGTADHYVYAHHDQSGLPVYIGLGRGNRIAGSRRECAKKLGVDPDELTSTFIFRGLTRREACEMETGFITDYGRQAEGGILINVAFGGNGPLSPEWLARMRAANHTPKSRAKRSAVHKGKPKSPKHAARIAARNRSPEQIARIIAARAALRANSNYVHPLKGRKADPEAHAKAMATWAAKRRAPGYIDPHIGLKSTPEQIASRVATCAAKLAAGYVSPITGRTYTPEHRAAIAAGHARRAAELAPPTQADIAPPLTLKENA